MSLCEPLELGGLCEGLPSAADFVPAKLMPLDWTLGQRAAVGYQLVALYLYEILLLVEMKTDTSSTKWPATVLSEWVE